MNLEERQASGIIGPFLIILILYSTLLSILNDLGLINYMFDPIFTKITSNVNISTNDYIALSIFYIPLLIGFFFTIYGYLTLLKLNFNLKGLTILITLGTYAVFIFYLFLFTYSNIIFDIFLFITYPLALYSIKNYILFTKAEVPDSIETYYNKFFSIIRIKFRMNQKVKFIFVLVLSIFILLKSIIFFLPLIEDVLKYLVDLNSVVVPFYDIFLEIKNIFYPFYDLLKSFKINFILNIKLDLTNIINIINEIFIKIAILGFFFHIFYLNRNTGSNVSGGFLTQAKSVVFDSMNVLDVKNQDQIIWLSVTATLVVMIIQISTMILNKLNVPNIDSIFSNGLSFFIWLSVLVDLKYFSVRPE